MLSHIASKNLIAQTICYLRKVKYKYSKMYFKILVFFMAFGTSNQTQKNGITQLVKIGKPAKLQCNFEETTPVVEKCQWKSPSRATLSVDLAYLVFENLDQDYENMRYVLMVETRISGTRSRSTMENWVEGKLHKAQIRSKFNDFSNESIYVKKGACCGTLKR